MPDLFSRLAANKDHRDIYRPLRDRTDLESQQPLDVDEENLAHDFHHDDLGDAERLALDDSRISTRSPVEPAGDMRAGVPGRSRQENEARWPMNDDDGDNDVPASLLVEGLNTDNSPKGKAPASTSRRPHRPASAGQPNRRRIQAQWETAQAHQRLHPDDEASSMSDRRNPGIPVRRPGFAATPKDKAMFRWANVSNLDVFIRDVYDYYLGAGLWCIVLDRLLHLLYVSTMRSMLCTMETDIPAARSLSSLASSRF